MPGKDSSETPMMRQYSELRKSVPENTLLLFRLGDFYELFGEDALTGSKILGITLTKRQNIPMAGIPHHAADSYVEKLINAGYKVAICDQTELARPGKIVRRQISKILSPGTVISESLLNPKHNQYLLSLKFQKNSVSIAWIEVSTGEFQIADAGNLCDLEHVIFALDPKEIIVDVADSEISERLPTRERESLRELLKNRSITELPHYYFDHGRNLGLLLENLKVSNLHGYGIAHEDPAISAAGALILYVNDNLKQLPNNLSKIRKFQQQRTMMIDANTVRNLEIFRNWRGGREHTLLSIIDYTKTAMGARLLEKLLMGPSIDRTEIVRRHETVREFCTKIECVDFFKKHLDQIADIPRILTRIGNNIRNPRELGLLRSTLEQLPEMTRSLAQFTSGNIQALTHQIDLFPELLSLLKNALAENLPNDIGGGGYIRDGFSEQVDHFRRLVHHSSEWLCEFEKEEQQRTKIKNLKVRYNNNFGYFIEVTKSNIHLVPNDYIRRQTTVNAERYTTGALKEKEREILSANDKLIELEQEILKQIAAEVIQESAKLYAISDALAEIDVYSGWGQLANRWNYCQPEIVIESITEIRGGRHPVLEKIIKESDSALAGMRDFIPNDTSLSSQSAQIALITGPNMAGKSTYIRQVAFITIMAQIGCWVPATSCKIGLADRIFSRIGANDDLSRGTSTFMVEMNETANILNNATECSLIILDEVGRGTSTYDGLSIAWAIVEFLHEHWENGPRTLFATHYHELTKLSDTFDRVKNYHVAVKEWNDEVIFLRVIEPGAADKSYGIHVAKLAGMPQSVTKRASEILESLESEGDIIQRKLRKNSSSQVISSQLDFGIF